MRRIGLAVVLVLSFLLAPLTTGAQLAGKVYRVGVLVQAPTTKALGLTIPQTLLLRADQVIQ
jgi:hypothetical protein